MCVWRWGVGGRVLVVRGGSLRRAKSIGLVLCRYLWLLFADEGVMPLDDFVFNTEAHPLRVHPEYQWGAEYGSLPKKALIIKACARALSSSLSLARARPAG